MTVKVEKLKRVFLFNGVKLPDPSPEFTVEQVRDTYVLVDVAAVNGFNVAISE